MKNRLTSFTLLLLVLVTFSGCNVIQDIFEAGVIVGVVAILLVLLIIFVIIRAVKS